MDTSVRFDIRIAIGALFFALGGVLAFYGFITRSNAQLYARSENIAINLWWGLIMAVFGIVMIFFGIRAKDRGPRTSARDAVTVLLLAIFLTPWTPVYARSDGSAQQRIWLPSAPVEAFAGEIRFDFDSVLNKTTVSYTAPLGKRDFLHRVFLATPTVHTISASYEFAGRISSHVPDTIRVRLESDEYMVATPENRFGLGTERTMTIDVGEHPVQRYLSLSQRIELDSNSRTGSSRLGSGGRAQDSFRLAEVRQVHVKRRATAGFTTCEFLSLINQREIRGTVAGLEFTVNREVIIGLNLFAAKMLPDSAQDRSVDCRSR